MLYIWQLVSSLHLHRCWFCWASMHKYIFLRDRVRTQTRNSAHWSVKISCDAITSLWKKKSSTLTGPVSAEQAFAKTPQSNKDSTTFRDIRLMRRSGWHRACGSRAAHYSGGEWRRKLFRGVNAREPCASRRDNTDSLSGRARARSKTSSVVEFMRFWAF